MYFRKIDHLAAGVACLVCAVLGILGYTLPAATEPPNRVWFEAEAGDVVFDHAYHAEFASCDDCHHDENMEGARRKKCRDCHYYGEARLLADNEETHPRMIGAQCVACHEDMDVAAGCDTCHVNRRQVYRVVAMAYPTLPETVAFEAEAGDVAFDHAIHVELGEDAPCSGCHHQVDWEGAPIASEKNCRACHYDQAERIGESMDENHTRFIGAQCANCHDNEDCTLCHEF